MARLRPFAGKTVRLRLFPLTLDLAIEENGGFVQATAAADAELALSPAGMANRLLGGKPGLDLIHTGGDAALGAEIAAIFRLLGWDVEEDLSRVVGDIAAHKLVGAGKDVLAWHRNAAETIAKSWAEHWQEESPLLAPPEETRALAGEIGELADRVDRLEQKIEKQLTTETQRHRVERQEKKS